MPKNLKEKTQLVNSILKKIQFGKPLQIKGFQTISLKKRENLLWVFLKNRKIGKYFFPHTSYSLYKLHARCYLLKMEKRKYIPPYRGEYFLPLHSKKGKKEKRKKPFFLALLGFSLPYPYPMG